MSQSSIQVVIPAAGIGRRMQADRPKQYLMMGEKTILEHTVLRLLSHPSIDQVILVLAPDDPYFPHLALSNHPQVICVEGGKERADSVRLALAYLNDREMDGWVMVHDAARPCVTLSDIDRLIDVALSEQQGAILAAPVKDTMKRANPEERIEHTVERNHLWHALTPQMFPIKALYQGYCLAEQSGWEVTDEASVMERQGCSPRLVQGRSDNIKITTPEDLVLAEFYLMRQYQA